MKSIDDCVKEAAMLSLPSGQTKMIVILERLEEKLDKMLELLAKFKEDVD